MNPELDERLRLLEKKVDDTYKIVYQMRRVQRNANLFKLFYWLIIIALGVISLFLIKPYISTLGEAYGITGGDTKNEKGNSLNSLLEQYKSLQE
jgi:hypothetical protein